MTHVPTPSPRLASLNAGSARQLFLATADLVLSIDSDRRVQEAVAGAGAVFPGMAGWVGLQLDDLLCAASRSKLPGLLADNGAEAAEPPRWRHVNLQRGRDSVPVLVRYYGYSGPGGGLHLIVGRDLRPTVAMQEQVQRAIIELERKAEALDPEVPRIGDPVMHVGSRSLRHIMDQTAQVLKWLCVAEALRLSEGDRSAAARLLDIAEDELDRLQPPHR
jgi:hypothetical protein